MTFSCLRSFLSGCVQRHRCNAETKRLFFLCRVRLTLVLYRTHTAEDARLEVSDVYTSRHLSDICTVIKDILSYQYLTLCHEGNMFQLGLNLLSNLHWHVHCIVVIAYPNLLYRVSPSAVRQTRNGHKIIVGGKVPEEGG